MVGPTLNTDCRHMHMIKFNWFMLPPYTMLPSVYKPSKSEEWCNPQAVWSLCDCEMVAPVERESPVVHTTHDIKGISDLEPPLSKSHIAATSVICRSLTGGVHNLQPEGHVSPARPFCANIWSQKCLSVSGGCSHVASMTERRAVVWPSLGLPNIDRMGISWPLCGTPERSRWDGEEAMHKFGSLHCSFQAF